jgi:hypothetical protein
MSDPIQPTTPSTPDAGAGQSSGAPQTPPATPAPQAQPTPEAAQPYRTFADQKALDDFVKGAKSQAERAAVRKLAKDMGFEDADEMRESLAALRQAQGGGQPTTPDAGATAATPGPSPASDMGARLQMAINVGAKLNLPAALLPRLQGATEAEMEADAQTLLGLMGSGASAAVPRPGIPPVPAGNQPVTFTRTQMQDPRFVRENAEAIRRAAAEGRIVKS